MSEQHFNGIIATGGTINVTSSPFGYKPTVQNIYTEAPERERGGHDDNERWDVGIITILAEETQAVIRALHLREAPVNGLRFYQTEIGTGGGRVKVAAIRTLEPGQRSAMPAYNWLREYYNPRTVLLVGIGGGIDHDLRPGDVVVSTRVVYYDQRKETPGGVQHRGQELQAPAETGHAINGFFTDHDPAEFLVDDQAGATRVMRMRAGLIGSGEAVIANHEAEILRYLRSFNDKIIAVDTEAGALAQACHEQSAASGRVHGWAIVRGISDDAGREKNDAYHGLASWHAAIAVRKLLPYLPADTPTPVVP